MWAALANRPATSSTVRWCAVVSTWCAPSSRLAAARSPRPRRSCLTSARNWLLRASDSNQFLAEVKQLRRGRGDLAAANRLLGAHQVLTTAHHRTVELVAGRFAKAA